MNYFQIISSVVIVLSIIVIIVTPDLVALKGFGFSRDNFTKFLSKDISKYNIYLTSGKYWILGNEEDSDFIAGSLGRFFFKYRSAEFGLIPKSHSVNQKIDNILNIVSKTPSLSLNTIIGDIDVK